MAQGFTIIRSNIIQVSGTAITLGQKAMATSLPVVLASDQASIPVTIAAGSAVIGHVITDSSSTTAVTQATAASLNATVVGTGTFVTQATLAAETTKVIGVVRTADGSGNLLTSTANALDINIKSGNLTTVAVTNVGTFAVQDTVLDAALITQEATTSGVKGLTVFGAVTTNAPTYTTTKSDALSLDTSGLLRISLKDTPANTNKLLVTPDTNVAVAQGTAAAVSAGWPVIGGELADTTGTFTNATQTTSVTTSSFDGYSTIIVSISGTYGTATGVFEISDDSGTTWYSVNAARSDGSGIETGYTSLTNTNRMWTLSVSGADEFRVRSTAVASGTVNVRVSVESMPTPEAASVSVYQPTGTNLHAVLDANSGVDIGKLTANQSVNLTQLVGTATDVNSGTKSAGTLRVVLATDQPALTNKLLVTPDSVALPANQSVNVSQINAVTPLMGNGVTGTGSQRVTIASDNTAFSVNIAADVPGTGATNSGKAEDAAHSSGDTGVMLLAVRNDTPGNAMTSTNGDYGAIAVDSAGRQSVQQKSDTATLTNVASSATSVTLLASNTARIGAQIYNDSTQICFVKFGTTASSTSFTVALASAVYYEVPAGYTGRIDGIWVSANGNARVTEIT